MKLNKFFALHFFRKTAYNNTRHRYLCNNTELLRKNVSCWAGYYVIITAYVDENNQVTIVYI